MMGVRFQNEKGVAMRWNTFFLVVFFAVTGCYTEIPEPESPHAYSVIVSKVAPVNCEAFGEVYGKSSSTDQEEAMRGARNDLRNKAAVYGANYVMLETSNVMPSHVLPHVIEIMLSGQAFKCPEPCSSNHDCPDLMYCASWGQCASACKSDGDCPETMRCNSFGECVTD